MIYPAHSRTGAVSNMNIFSEIVGLNPGCLLVEIPKHTDDATKFSVSISVITDDGTKKILPEHNAYCPMSRQMAEGLIKNMLVSSSIIASYGVKRPGTAIRLVEMVKELGFVDRHIPSDEVMKFYYNEAHIYAFGKDFNPDEPHVCMDADNVDEIMKRLESADVNIVNTVDDPLQSLLVSH